MTHFWIVYKNQDWIVHCRGGKKIICWLKWGEESIVTPRTKDMSNWSEPLWGSVKQQSFKTWRHERISSLSLSDLPAKRNKPTNRSITSNFAARHTFKKSPKNPVKKTNKQTNKSCFKAKGKKRKLSFRLHFVLSSWNVSHILFATLTVISQLLWLF